MNHAELIQIINTNQPIFNWPVRIYYEDTDAAGVVYFANYLKFMERARTEWLRQFGCEHTDLANKEQIAFTVRSLTAEYLKPARLNESLEVKTIVKKIGKARLDLIQYIVRNQDLLVTSETTIACININTFKPVAIPEPLLSLIENTK